MSKSRPFFCLAILVILFAAVSAMSAPAELNVVVAQNGFETTVDLVFTKEFGQPPRNLSFVRSIAGVALPAGRIGTPEIFDGSRRVDVRRFADGEFVAGGDFDRVRYVLDLRPPPDSAALAHFSWFQGSRGVFALRDLLPEINRRVTARVRFERTGAANLYSTVPRDRDESFFFSDMRDGIVFADDAAEKSDFVVGDARVVILKSGEWQTSTPKIVAAATGILENYSQRLGAPSAKSILVSLSKFPAGTPPGRWRAETRGGVVTIVSSEANFQMQSEQKLMEQLRHELFHLWFPGSLNLTGSYDWFYEGFALYISLRAALDLRQIRFDDFLDTISRAAKIDRSTRRRQSLLDASANRWSGGDLTVYARGLLVAFAVDVRLLEANRRYSVFEFLRRISADHGPASNPVAANEALSQAFAARPEISGIWHESVAGTGAVDLKEIFATAAIEVVQPGGDLRVKSKLNRSQKDLLDKLGYNSWRKKTD